MREEAYKVSITQLSWWFDIPRRTLYYQPKKQERKIDPAKEQKVKKMMEKFFYHFHRKRSFCCI